MSAFELVHPNQKPIKQEKDGSYQVHDQIVHFVGGVKRYCPRIKYIWENEMTHLLAEDGTEYIINKSNVLFVERKIKLPVDSED